MACNSALAHREALKQDEDVHAWWGGHMGDLDLLLQVITALHDTCFDDDKWPLALALVAQLLRSSTATFAIESNNLTFPIIRSFGMPLEATEAYATNFHSLDPVIAHARTSTAGIAYTDWMAIDPEKFDHTRFANEYAAPFDMRHCVQAFTDRRESFSGFLVAARPDRGGSYTEEDRRIVHALLPHVRQALQVRRHLHAVEGQRLAALDVLDRLEHGAFLVDADLKVLFVNRQGEVLLGSESGLMTRDGRLTAASHQAMLRLRRAVWQAISHELDPDPQPIMIERYSSPRPLLLRVVPLRKPTDISPMLKASAFLLAADPDRPAKGKGVDLSAVFGLTPAENRVANLLADERNPASIAAQIGVSIATVRTHMSQIFAKTGTSRQADYIALIAKIRGI